MEPKKPEPPKPEPPKPEPPRPDPPKQEPKKPEPPKPEPPKEVKKPEPPKQEAKKPEPAKPEAPKKAEPEKKQPDAKQDFASVLKNLQNLKPEPSNAPAQPQRQQPAPSPSAQSQQPAASNAPKLSDRLTASQEDAVRRTVEACWNVDPGLMGINEITVEIRLEIGRDGQVMRAEVVDKARMARDRAFRTVAESAQRAVMNPRCRTLPLPPDGYDFWKNAVFVFSPRDMLRG
ncbi:energy transducer TonB [Skermanella pratensis]|uniref:energy transducer TonB n=1 Tax=Skermanella pratensis TaxID=2233999 RepID=UPI001FEB54B1|nr:energy transducer TonB [Skermanella pratensis]